MYMFIVSLIVFLIEPTTFDNSYLKSFYWAGITLTTVGYGDIYPITTIGQMFALLSSFIGIGIIALPTGLIGSSLLEEYRDIKDKE